MNELIETILKQLPPSSSRLQLLNLSVHLAPHLESARNDLNVTSLDNESLMLLDQSRKFDAVVAVGNMLESEVLGHVLVLLRSGGRLIIIDLTGDVERRYVDILESIGYTRILVEPAIGDAGILIRGEKPHVTMDTFQRIQSVATADVDLLNLDDYKGRYVYLLIKQTPNKPVWRLDEDEEIRWEAVMIEQNDIAYMLAFSSLPKAVGFMQSAVMQGLIHDINKMGKFSIETAKTWAWKSLVNPDVDILPNHAPYFVSIDPQTAELPDE